MTYSTNATYVYANTLDKKATIHQLTTGADDPSLSLSLGSSALVVSRWLCAWKKAYVAFLSCLICLY